MRRTLLVAALALIATPSAGLATAPQPGGLIVRVVGASAKAERVFVECYASKRAWDREKASLVVLARRTSSGLEADFSELGPGEYAFVVYEDRNGNRELDFNGLGIPTEPVGISNDHEDTSLRFDEHKLRVTTERQIVEIRIQ